MSVKKTIALLREAVLGSEQNFTEGGIGRAIALLSVPMILEMVMESLFGIVNVFYVARLGAEAIATVGLTESMLTIVFGIAIGLSMATTATVARRTGENDPEGAAVAAVQSIIIGVLTSLPLAVAGIAFAPTLLSLMGAEAGVIRIGSGYAAIILGGNVCILLLFLINAIFRGAGDAAAAMRALWLANIVNIILDPCFIFGLGPFPELGVTGSAIATTIGRGSGVVFQLWILLSGRSRVRVRRKHLRLDVPVMLKLLRISVGGMFQFLVATASWLGLTRIIALFGSSALAGYTLSLRILIFAMLPSWGLSNAAATLVGQNLGAGKPERAERSVMLAGLSNVVFLSMVALIFIVFTERIIGIFTTDASVISYGVTSLRIISYGFIFYGYGMVMVQAFNGAGDTFTPTVINLFCYWLFQIPLAYALAIHFNLGARGVFIAIPIAETLLTVLAIIYFRRGRWKAMKV
ncbi:MAG TPA: MATE family efflux transporter [Pyrinomonadaceae bacterium]|nr:MATE family efflux transporter [Pyrinomonadaceae bacterium]